MTHEEKFVKEIIEYVFTYPDDDYMTMECLCRKLHKHELIAKVDGHWQPIDKRCEDCIFVEGSHWCDGCDKTPKGMKEYDEYWTKADRKTEPTISKMEQVEDEPQTETQTETQNSNLTFEKRTMRDCYNCKKYETEGECIECHYEAKDEPQTERSE